MTHQEDEGSLQVILALLIAVAILAVLFIPAPPAEEPQEPVHLSATSTSFIKVAEASEPEVVLLEIRKKIELFPELLPVCSCESTGSPNKSPQHYEADGITPLVGRIDPQDRGMCQLNLRYHGAAAEARGLDVLGDENDYIEYVNDLFSDQGYAPWSASKHCWSK